MLYVVSLLTCGECVNDDSELVGIVEPAVALFSTRVVPDQARRIYITFSHFLHILLLVYVEIQMDFSEIISAENWIFWL